MLTETDKILLGLTFGCKNIDEIWKINSIQNLFQNKEAIEHIFVGCFDVSNSLMGYHSEAIYPNKYNQDSYPINQNLDKTKVYCLYLYAKNSQKISSCFPITMTVEDVILCIDDAYEDLIKKKKNGICGNVGYSKKYNLSIFIFMDYQKKIFNAYPTNSF